MKLEKADSAGSGVARSVSAGLLVAACAISCGSPGSLTEPVAMESSPIQNGATDAIHKVAVGVVQLAQAQQNMVAFCSGVLLAPNLVATARHCVAQLTSTTIDCTTSTFGPLYPANQVFITTDTTITMSSHFEPVTTVIVPTGANQKSVCGNDIALLILDKSVTLPDYAEPVIAPPMTDTQYQATVTAIGYGIDTPTDTQGTSAGIRRIKQNVALTCVPNDKNYTDCFTDPMAKAVLTAGEFVSGDSTCEGDSGSAAFEQGSFDRGVWKAFGVLSRGGVSQDGTTCQQPIYTRFDAWGSLIKMAAEEAAAQATAKGLGYPLAAWAGGTSDAGTTTTIASTTPADAGVIQVTASSAGGCSLASAPGWAGGASGEAAGLGASERAGALPAALGLAFAAARRRRRRGLPARSA